MPKLKPTHSRWDDVPHEEMTGTIGRRFLHSPDSMVAQIRLKPGSRVPAHRHDNEQWTYVLEGELHLTFGDAQDETIVVRENEIVHIPGNLLHSAFSPGDCFELDFFTPPRADWLDGSDAYLRGGGEPAGKGDDDA